MSNLVHQPQVVIDGLRRKHPLALVAVVAAALCTVGGIGNGHVAADEAELAEVQTAVDQYVDAYNQGAIAALMEFWAEDADFVDIRGNFHAGRDVIVGLFRRGFANHPGRTIRLTSDVRKSLAPNVVMDDGILELTTAEGEVARGRYAVIWRKQDGRWRIRSARDIPLESDDQESTPTDEADRPPLSQLSWLRGHWRAESEKYQISLDCDWDLDETFLVQNFEIKSSEESFTVRTYIAYDPSEQQLRSWYFDSRGGFGGGYWSQQGDQWVVEVDAVLPDGAAGTSLMIWQPLDPNTLSWKAIHRTVDGEPLPDAEQKYVRK